jgi:hypothetical protein
VALSNTTSQPSYIEPPSSQSDCIQTGQNGSSSAHSIIGRPRDRLASALTIGAGPPHLLFTFLGVVAAFDAAIVALQIMPA